MTIRGLLSKMGDGSGPGGWWMGGVPPHGYDLRYEAADGAFLLVVRYMPDGSKQILDESGSFTRTLARGDSLSTSKVSIRSRIVGIAYLFPTLMANSPRSTFLKRAFAPLALISRSMAA